MDESHLVATESPAPVPSKMNYQFSTYIRHVSDEVSSLKQENQELKFEWLSSLHVCERKGFGRFVESEDDSEELVRAIVSKEGVEHMIVHNILDIEVGKWIIMDFERDYREFGYELGLETDGNDDNVFLDVPVLQL
ncbi:hypothetical protein CQW23_24352 [Capsicum baccatum]|uniref:Uncharacterized protein n=1 Tax=Capsicum baccatum TaxID=33114 RepID=A0A2G2VUM5_CAPBA|nr:hypothetical protein CQW23_24352 [Capsicum baccatum]